MAEKDAQYYYEQAKNARANGKESLAQIMENYARQIDPVYQDRAMRAGFIAPPQERGGWNPASNPNAPTRESLQNMYNQKMAVEQPQSNGGYVPAQAAPPTPHLTNPPQNGDGGVDTVVNGGGRDDSEVREGGYITADNNPPASPGQNYGIRYVDNQGNPTDYVVAKQKPYYGNKLQQAAQAYYGGGVELNTPWANNNREVTQEELTNIGMYDPNSMASQQGKEWFGFKKWLYPEFHGANNSVDDKEYDNP